MEYSFADRLDNLQASAIREIFKYASDPEVIFFAAGNPSAESFPKEEIQKIATDILTQNPIKALQYGNSEGYFKLRENIKKVILKKEDIVKENDDIVIMSGAQQGIELSCKVLCNKDDVIICENPSFVGSLNSFKSYGVNLLGISMEHDGICLEELELTLKNNKKVKMIYLIPNFQNPTGFTMSLEKRKAVLSLAKKYDVMILEDNPYGDLRFKGEHIPSIKSMDTEGRVIYCGSFSKILSPGLRVGYVVADKKFLEKIIICKQCSDVHTSMLSQLICNDFLEKIDYEKHILKLQKIYKHKSDLMISQLDQSVSNKLLYSKPEGGLFIWCTLPKKISVDEFCKRAVKEKKVAVVPGKAFLSSDNLYTQSFRINYSTPTDEEIIKGISLLKELLEEYNNI